MSGFGLVQIYKTNIHLPSMTLKETAARPEMLPCALLY